MAKFYLDNDAIQDLASHRLGLDILSTAHQYIIPDYIFDREVGPDLRDSLIEWGNQTGSLSILPVSESIDFTNPAVASRYGVELEFDSTGSPVFPRNSQLGDGVYRYLYEQGEFFTVDLDGNRNSFLISKDNSVREISNLIDDVFVVSNNRFGGAPQDPASLMLYQLERGDISKQTFQDFVSGLRLQAATYGGFVPSDQDIDRIAIDYSGAVPLVTYDGVALRQGMLTAAAVGAEALRQAGLVGDVYEVALAVSKSQELIDAGDTVGAEAVWAELGGNLLGGAVGGAGMALFAGGILSGSGVGTIPVVVVTIAAAVAGGVAGAAIGQSIASNIHNFAVEKLHGGEALILDDLIEVYHDQLKIHAIYEETLLTQSLVGVSNSDAAAIEQALIRAVNLNPDIRTDTVAFEDALVLALAGHLSAGLAVQSGEIFDTVREFANRECFAAGTLISMSDGTFRPIESIQSGDAVASYDGFGNLVSGRVTRTFQPKVKHLLDVHGLKVTPGHVTLCGDGKFAGRHVPMIDILRSDGALVRESGELVRACTDEQVGSELDRFIHAFTGERNPDGSVRVLQSGKIRLGTKFITDESRLICIADIIAELGGKVTPEGLIQSELGGEGVPFMWPFGPRLPKPEDYVLQRSHLTLGHIYAADEWEAVPPRMPVPPMGEAASVEGPDRLITKSVSAPVYKSAPTTTASAMSRKQRRAAQARGRKSRAKAKVLVH